MKAQAVQEDEGRKSDKIADYIEKKAKVLTRELVREFGVSVPTIHRIFDRMSADGKIKRVHGGAISLINREESLFDKKLKSQRESKRAICAYAAKHFVQEDDVIGIDSGTTAYHLVEYMKVHNITIISNGLKIASHAAQMLPHANIVSSGGTVRPQLSACVGTDAIEFFKSRKLNTLMLTCSGVEVERNSIYEVDSLIAEVKRAMIAAAKRVVLLVTSDKMNTPAFTYLTKLSSVNDIVSDSGFDKSLLNALPGGSSAPKIHIAPPIA